MDKYRLTWQGDGSLDLSQVLDDRGVPIVLATRGAGATVDAVTFQHPLVQHYLKSGLEAAKLGAPAPVAAPAATMTATPVAPDPAPEEAPPEPPKEPPKEEPKTHEVDLKDSMSVEEKPVVVTSTKEEEPDADEDAPSSKGSRRTSKRRGSRK